MAVTLRYDWGNRENKTTGALSEPSLTDVKSGVVLALTRATTASVTDYNNIIKEVVSGEERYTGARRVENLCVQSNDFDTTWTSTNSTETQGATDPDGGTTAWTLADDSGGGGDVVIQTGIAITLKADSSYTFSYYAKADQLAWTMIEIDSFTVPASNTRAWFDLTNGVEGTTPDAEFDATGIIDAGNGWYRVWGSFTLTSDNIGVPRMSVVGADNDHTDQDDGTSSILIWRAQIENVSGQADPAPSEYQATTTAAVAKWYATNKSGAAINPTGLLVEEARTNICLQSETFSVSWVNTNTDEVLDTATAPDGTLTADGLSATSTADQANAIYQAFTGRTAAQATTISGFFKSGIGATKVQLAYDAEGAGSDGFFCNFDLSAGTKGTVTALAAGTATASIIDDVGNGWFRCTIVGSIAVGTVARFTISISDNISGAVFEAANLTDNDSIFCWGAQVEVSLNNKKSSYIPTVASSVTRNAEPNITTTLSFLDAAATEAGTWYVKGNFPDAGTAVDKILTLDDGGATDRMYLELDAAENVNFATTHSADTDGASDGAGVIAANTAFRVAAAYADDDVIAYVDGASSGADTAAAIPLADAMTTLRVGSDSAGNYFNGHIAEIIHDNTRLVNGTLEDWSNGLNLPVSANITGIEYPRDAMPTDTSRFNDFITDSGITKTGDLQLDYRAALFTVLGPGGKVNDYSLNDIFKRYFESL